MTYQFDTYGIITRYRAIVEHCGSAVAGSVAPTLGRSLVHACR